MTEDWIDGDGQGGKGETREKVELGWGAGGSLTGGTFSPP